MVLTYALYLDVFWFCSVELPRAYVCEFVIWMLGFWKGLRAVSSLVCYRNCLPCCIVVFSYIVQSVSNYGRLCNRYSCTCNCITFRAYICSFPQIQPLNTLRTGDADLRFYITTVQDGWRKSAFLTHTSFPCIIHLIMQYIEAVSECSCWRMFIETWPHSELNFRHRASSV
jgi:hypothetical protein